MTSNATFSPSIVGWTFTALVAGLALGIVGSTTGVEANGDILQLLIFTVLVGAAVGRLPQESRAPLSMTFQSLADAMLVLVSWIMWGTPVGVFALILAFTLGAGFDVVGMFGIYLIGVCGFLLLVTILLYPFTTVLGRVSLRDFVRAARASQLVALGTQSSLASLPAMVEGGRKELGLPAEATGFVLPLCVSTFKMNQAVSPTFKLLFAAHILGVPLGIADMSVATILSRESRQEAPVPAPVTIAVRPGVRATPLL